MGGIPSATTEAGFFDAEVESEGTDEGGSNDGRVGKLEVSNGSTGRGGKGGWSNPEKNNTGSQVLNWQSGVGVGQLYFSFSERVTCMKQHKLHSGPPVS